jgi:hypothetical protein
MKLQLTGKKIDGKWAIQFPDELIEKIYKSFDKSNGRCELEIFDRKPRTTGGLSQNHRIAYLCNLIAGEVNKPGETRESYQSVKDLAKLRAIKRGYPYKFANVIGPNGGMRECILPAHESDIDTVAAMHLIDELELLAAESGIDTVGQI